MNQVRHGKIIWCGCITKCLNQYEEEQEVTQPIVIDLHQGGGGTIQRNYVIKHEEK